MEEPSVLDFIKSILNPWSKEKIRIPVGEPQEQEKEESLLISEEITAEDSSGIAEQSISDEKAEEKRIRAVKLPFPWLILIVLFLALSAQRFLEPPQPNFQFAIVLYIVCFLGILWSFLRNDWFLPEGFSIDVSGMERKAQVFPLVAGSILSVVTLLAFGNHLFTGLNLVLWAAALLCFFLGLWIFPKKTLSARISQWVNSAKSAVLRIQLSPYDFLFIVVWIVIFFFRFYQLADVPGEMFSDHAEKLLDVNDVLNGQFSVFFPRNTGREAIQMYLTAAVSIIFGTGLSFMSLKIGTALAGFLTLPYIYLLGKEIGNRWVGLLAILLAGFAYWPNVISRVGLRFPLYPLFVAPCLYYLIRGLRRNSRNDFLLSGFALGLGLHGYSPTRFLPFVVTIITLIFLIHPQAKGRRRDVILAWVLLALIALIAFLPLLRYWIDNPDMFGYRAFTRLGTTERDFPAPVWQIFFDNLWKAEVMFFWNNGNIWVHSIPNRPALDVVTGSLYFIGTMLLFFRYVKKRDWVDLALLISIPMLMMPSILSLAFPEENPSLNRTGGAIIPVFIVAAIGLESILSSFYRRLNKKSAAIIVGLIAVFLLSWSAGRNYQLVFHQYKDQFLAGAWNTSDMGRVIRGYADSIGERDTAYVVPYPYWVDTRLVGINAGFPTKDYALWPEDFSTTLSVQTSKLFIVKPEDTQSIDALNALYPQGIWKYYDAKLEGHDFWIFLVIPMEKR